MKNNRYRRIRWMMTAILFIGAAILGQTGGKIAVRRQDSFAGRTRAVNTEAAQAEVVIDAGHGGNDSGKVGLHGELEKEINLSIARRVQIYLEEAGVETMLTRTDDDGLYHKGERNKKMADMRARCEIIEKSHARLVVSIHQNSYGKEAVKGPQVFYYAGSKEGQTLAEILQSRFDYIIEENRRKATSNTDYYLLIHVPCPIVIVECGFLSNEEECRKLAGEAYQDRVAWTIFMGIMQYRNRQDPCQEGDS